MPPVITKSVVINNNAPVGCPPGGTEDQILAKNSNLNFDYKWIDSLPVQPKRYKALLSQTGASIPTSVILENTFTDDITFSYVAPGLYQVNSVGEEFTAKTAVSIGSNNNASFSSPITYNTFNITSVGFMLATFDATTFTNGILDDTLILIEVYP